MKVDALKKKRIPLSGSPLAPLSIFGKVSREAGAVG